MRQCCLRAVGILDRVERGGQNAFAPSLIEGGVQVLVRRHRSGQEHQARPEDDDVFAGHAVEGVILRSAIPFERWVAVDVTSLEPPARYYREILQAALGVPFDFKRCIRRSPVPM
jgi:hypothetical protein